MRRGRISFGRLPKKISLLLFLAMGQTITAEENVSDTLFGHVLNSRKLDLFPYLREITLPFNLTVHHLMLLLSIIIVSVLYLRFSTRDKMKPRKIQIGLEALVVFVRDDIVYPIMGEEKGKKWLAFYATLFVFLLTTNLLGLIPAFKTATGNINVTLSLGILVLILTFGVGIKEIGVAGFFKNLFPAGAPFPVALFVAFLEFISIFTKSFILGIRLFVNMFAGHMAILSFLVLIFLISPFFGFISVPFAVFTYLLEVLIALLQALVFTLLSCIFISMASSH